MPEALSFDDLVARWKVRVFRLAGRFFPRPEDAEDVAQEVFLKVFRSLGSYRGEAPLEHWILRIATTTCQDELRRRRRRPETTVSAAAGALRGNGADAGAPDAVSPEALLERALAGKALDAAEAAAARSVAADLLDRLPARDRVVLTLLDLEGFSAAEVADFTGSTRAAVKVRAMRARRALRRMVA
ncbi:MAG TPA: sigma-70 family RNA polymerase sigma factor [Candidatus Polarisedimenticolia bacterium]|nr:sigma-70 family RNA polymerase sigma factor [Candidatus Polarisedimenticolia bacterium]